MKRIFSKFRMGNDFNRDRGSRRRQRGVIMMLTALMITVMIGFLALSIDLGFAFSSRGQFQNGIDAAALAAAAALRLTIETSEPGAQQQSVAEQLAVEFAGKNQVRRYSDPAKDDPSPNANSIVITAGNVQVQTSTSEVNANYGLPRVKVDSNIPVPTLFAGMFGLNGFTVSASATATVVPVDGGTGTIGVAKATIGGGCWSPVMLPDTFFDGSNNVHWVGDPARGEGFDYEWPRQFGDYYRSRFAAGARNTPPYLDAYSGTVSDYVTGVRDTKTFNDITINKSIMGRYIEIKPKHYRIANLSALPQVTSNPYSVGGFAQYGYCGQIRVGRDIPIYDKDDVTVYDQVRVGLQALKFNSLDNDFLDVGILNNFRYVKSGEYPSPNTHAMIIPVMLFSPVEIAKNEFATELIVTNIGMFFLQEVRNDGTLTGFFVREIVAGGTPIDAANLTIESDPSFKRTWLPMSVQLVK